MIGKYSLNGPKRVIYKHRVTGKLWSSLVWRSATATGDCVWAKIWKGNDRKFPNSCFETSLYAMPASMPRWSDDHRVQMTY